MDEQGDAGTQSTIQQYDTKFLQTILTVNAAIRMESMALSIEFDPLEPAVDNQVTSSP